MFREFDDDSNNLSRMLEELVPPLTPRCTDCNDDRDNSGGEMVVDMYDPVSSNCTASPRSTASSVQTGGSSLHLSPLRSRRFGFTRSASPAASPLPQIDGLDVNTDAPAHLSFVIRFSPGQDTPLGDGVPRGCPNGSKMVQGQIHHVAAPETGSEIAESSASACAQCNGSERSDDRETQGTDGDNDDGNMKCTTPITQWPTLSFGLSHGLAPPVAPACLNYLE